MTAEKNSQKNTFKEDMVTYFKGVKTEWSKVSWPTKKQIIAECGIVLLVVTFFTLVVYFMDIIFKALLGLIK
ncbi:MAG: preprotein translocase subunit SecE [Candidatus Gastranaerophilales bacterium]|nr:preprotein translocase subunit SecE [Candidatus Gastranaerophilales bacterium]